MEYELQRDERTDSYSLPSISTETVFPAIDQQKRMNDHRRSTGKRFYRPLRRSTAWLGRNRAVIAAHIVYRQCFLRDYRGFRILAEHHLYRRRPEPEQHRTRRLPAQQLRPALLPDRIRRSGGEAEQRSDDSRRKHAQASALAPECELVHGAPRLSGELVPCCPGAVQLVITRL